MTTKLEGPLKREITIDRADYTLTITPDGLLLASKGKRKGFELEWRALIRRVAACAPSSPDRNVLRPTDYACIKDGQDRQVKLLVRCFRVRGYFSGLPLSP